MTLENHKKLTLFVLVKKKGWVLTDFFRESTAATPARTRNESFFSRLGYYDAK